MTSAIVDRFDIAPQEGMKAPCRAATTVDITLEGLQVVDTVSVIASDRVLVTAQANAADNGIYDVRATAWQRASDFNDNLDVVSGVAISVYEGTDGRVGIWQVLFDGPLNIGITDLTFFVTNTGGGGGTIPTTPYTRSLLTAVDAAAARTTLDAAQRASPATLNNIALLTANGDPADSGKSSDLIVPFAIAAGSAQAITATYSPSVTLADTTQVRLRAQFANTAAAPTFSPDSLAARPIVKQGGVALSERDIAGPGHELILVSDDVNARWELLNPATSSATGGGESATIPITTPTAHNLVIGEVVDRNSGKANPSVSTTTATGFVAGVTSATGYLFQSSSFLTLTELEWTAQNDQGTALTPGQFYFASSTNPGNITTTAPTVGAISNPVGLALTNIIMDVRPYVPSVVGEGTAGGGPTDSEIVQSVNNVIGNTLWQTQLTNPEVVAAVNAILGNTDWQTRLTDSQVVAAVDAALGNIDWKTRLTDSQVVTAVNTSLGNILWQTQLTLADESTPTLGGDLISSGNALTGTSYNQAADVSIGTGTHTFNYTSSDMQQVTATGNITIAFSNFPAGKVVAYVIDAINWGAFGITLPAGMVFAGGTVPPFTAAGTDRIRIIKDKDEVFSLSIVDEGLA
tara:strand:- start:451 stop:2349 length:1899 start_codon:yes stop_codon:yes gene_type:complete